MLFIESLSGSLQLKIDFRDRIHMVVFLVFLEFFCLKFNDLLHITI